MELKWIWILSLVRMSELKREKYVKIHASVCLVSHQLNTELILDTCIEPRNPNNTFWLVLLGHILFITNDISMDLAYDQHKLEDTTTRVH